MRLPTDPTVAAPRCEIAPGIWLDARLALWLASERLLVIADLHWGYAESHRARGNLLPAWGDDEIETRLRSLLADYQPAEMLWLGDIVHAAEGSTRVEKFLRESTTPITPLAGNHDRRWRGAAQTFTQRGGYFFHHGDVPRAVPTGALEIIGHHHPAVTWSDGAGGNVKLPALVVNTQRWVLPAFSPWAAGTACTSLLTPDAQVWAIAPRRIFPVRLNQRPTAAA